MQEIKKQIETLKQEINKLAVMLCVQEKKTRVDELQLSMAKPGFWEDVKSASGVVAELKDLKNDVDDWYNLDQRLNELGEVFSLGDLNLETNLLAELKKLKNDCETLRLRILFPDKFDQNNAYLSINSGAGGTEACDWANMLFRMYFKWAEDKKFKFKVLDELKGEEAGLKSVTFMIEGKRAYGLLKSERGVHRLVRISPFDANKRRHTSFASVDVLPEIKEDGEIQIKPEDLRIDTYRSSGAGGQHVNVTDSAVRIKHLPTGIIVSCQNERSQHQNKFTALNILKAKLYKIKEEESKKELNRVSGEKQRIEWGSQIRSYVLHPYLLVKDHRTDLELHDARAVLEGKLDDFIYAYLKAQINVKEADSGQ